MSSAPRTRDRFLRDAVPVRIGGIAANMARVSSFSADEDEGAAVRRLINESKWFIEWTAAEAPPETGEQLVSLQIQLARWEHDWDGLWSDPDRRSQMAAQAKDWSDRVLEMSGLLY